MKKLFDEIPELESEKVRLRQVRYKDAEALRRMIGSPAVYRYLPPFLFELQYPDVYEMIAKLYGDLFHAKQSLILAVEQKETGSFCGLAEFYGYKDHIHKTCIGYRLAEPFWGKGIASDTVQLMVRYLYEETDIEIITASTMVENRASARVLEKAGFRKSEGSVPEDWGSARTVTVDKWLRQKGYMPEGQETQKL